MGKVANSKLFVFYHNLKFEGEKVYQLSQLLLLRVKLQWYLNCTHI